MTQVLAQHKTCRLKILILNVSCKYPTEHNISGAAVRKPQSGFSAAIYTVCASGANRCAAKSAHQRDFAASSSPPECIL